MGFVSFEVNYGIRLSCNRCGASKPLKRKAPSAGHGRTKTLKKKHKVDGGGGWNEWLEVEMKILFVSTCFLNEVLTAESLVKVASNDGDGGADNFCLR